MPQLNGETWLGVMHEVELLRLPLLFGRSHADVTLSEGGAVATRGVVAGATRAATSIVVMRSGRHFVQFTVVEGDEILFGVIRADWDSEGGVNLEDVDGHCFYCTDDGLRFPGFNDWEGMQTAEEPGDRIGLLLDLDQGSMTVWKDEEKLGVMVAEGLSGPYCWAVEMYESGESVGIESAALPADA